jgi:uncharacterized membrane protein
VDRSLEDLHARVEELSRELREVHRRLDLLEAREGATSAVSRTAAPDRGAGIDSPPEPGPERRAPTAPARTVIALVGRTLVILGGAYLFRALSDREVIPPLMGAVAGMAYAMWWLIEVDRTMRRGERLSAVFYGLGAAMIAYPLIWETTVRFEILAPAGAAVGLVLFLLLGLAVAWRRDLSEVAWSATLLTVGTAIGLLFATRDFLPLTLALLSMALAVEVLAFRDRWLGLRWPAALGLDLAVVMLASVAVAPEAPREGFAGALPAGAIAVGLAVPLLYLASIGARTLLRQRLITPFEVFQAAAALLAGLSGAVRVIASAGADPMAIGAAIVLLGALCYAAAFASIDRRSGRGRNFYSYTSFAGLLVLAGSYMVLGGSALALIWSALAIVAVGLGGWFNRITLRFHGAIYVVAAAVVAGLMASALDGLLAAPTDAWRPLTPLGIWVALVGAACYGVLLATPAHREAPWFESLPQAIIAAVVAWSAAGTASGLLSGPLTVAFGATDEVAFLAAGRTAVLAALAVALAWAGRRWSLQELTWLVYPVLVGGGLKLLWEDLRYGQPITMFLGLALYGGALIATPRLMRREP